MLNQQQELRRRVVEILSMEDLVPRDHLLRQVDGAVDFIHIYDFVEDLYCKDNGRPSVDPVVLFKIVMIQHLFGTPSLRRTMEEIKVNIAYRWFLGYALSDELPHFSTVSYNFRHRITSDTTEQVFQWILYEANRAGCLAPEAVYIDGTHIKASANIHRKIKQKVPTAAARYKEELFEEINRDREAHGKPPFKDDGDQPPEEKKILSWQRMRVTFLITKRFTKNARKKLSASLPMPKKNTLCVIPHFAVLLRLPTGSGLNSLP